MSGYDRLCAKAREEYREETYRGTFAAPADRTAPLDYDADLRRGHARVRLRRARRLRVLVRARQVVVASTVLFACTAGGSEPWALLLLLVIGAAGWWGWDVAEAELAALESAARAPAGDAAAERGGGRP